MSIQSRHIRVKVKSAKENATMMLPFTDQRSFHEYYRQKLMSYLAEHSVKVLEQPLVCVDSQGFPSDEILSPDSQCLPLRKDEQAIHAAIAENAVFALPASGISLRILRGNPGKDFWARFQNLEKDDRCRSLFQQYSPYKGIFLAVAGDGRELYALRVNGFVASTKDVWQTCRCFDPMEELRNLTEKYLSKETFQAALAPYLSGAKTNVPGCNYDALDYDRAQKAIILTTHYGNAHEGIYESYHVLDKDQYLEKYACVDWERASKLLEGQLPAEILIDQLAENSYARVPNDKLVY